MSFIFLQVGDYLRRWRIRVAYLKSATKSKNLIEIKFELPTWNRRSTESISSWPSSYLNFCVCCLQYFCIKKKDEYETRIVIQYLKPLDTPQKYFWELISLCVFGMEVTDNVGLLKILVVMNNFFFPFWNEIYYIGKSFIL